MYYTSFGLNSPDQILVLKEYSYPANEWLYQFPGGFVSDKEGFEQGMNRELMEEANLKATDLKLLGSFYYLSRRTNNQAYVFLAQGLVEEKLDADKEEEIETLWFTEEEIDNLIKENKFKNGSSLSAWTIYKASKLTK